MKLQTKCIYCGSSGPFSEEHALSRCLGEFRGFPHLLNRICATCNGEIGKIEEQIGRSGPEAFFPRFLNVEGRATHDKVNLFHRGSAGAKPIDVMARLPESDINILWEINEGQNTVREVRQIVFIDENRKSFPIRIHEWMKTTDQLRQEIKKHGLDLKSGKYSAMIFVDDAEKEWGTDLGKGLGSGIHWSPPPGQGSISNPVIKVTVTNLYFRAVAKVGFHYFLTVNDKYRGDEAEFDEIRQFIRYGGNADQYIKQTPNPIVSFPRGMGPNGWGHILLVENKPDVLESRIQFFLGPNYSPLVYLIQLCKQPLSDLGKWTRGHYFRYFDEGPQGKYAGEVSNLTAIPN